MAMPAEAKTSLISGLDTLTARLDGLTADQGPEDLSKALRSAFAEPELYKMHLSFLAEDKPRVEVLLEVFDKALKAPQHDIKVFKKFRQLCGRAGLLPASHIIPEGTFKTTEHPIASGTYGDVWEGIHSDKRVAIKALRIYKNDDVQKVRKVFCKEVAMWKRVSHTNIVPFLGVSEGPAPLSMVSEWMPNGNVRNYVRQNPEISRLQMLLDISRGLAFLHSVDIVHGDLKGENILVDKSGCARLGDFGFTTISSLNCTETSASGTMGTYRWMAPEIFISEQGMEKVGTPTARSDIFALGMVAIEVFTGEVPFPKLRPIAVMTRIIEGECPPRPLKTTRLGLSDELWGIIQSSWAKEASERPAVPTYVDLLERAVPDMALLQQLTEFDANSDDHIQKLDYMFGYGDNTLLGMREDETLVLIEVFDQVLNSSPVDSTTRSQCLRGLQKVSARFGVLPKSYSIPRSSLIEPDEAFSARGRLSDTRKWSMDGQLVAVKTINPEFIGDFNTFKQKLSTNGVMWKRVRHKNVVGFLGFAQDSPPFSLVYPWMPNGTLSDYLREHPNADRLGLLLDVVRGLTYLHQYNFVHGNLTGRNILVDDDGTARISEYGLEPVLREESSPKLLPTNVRWMAPEVILVNNSSKRVDVEEGKRADMYSLSMIMFEILTDTIPFPDASDEEVVDKVKMGLRPDWPSEYPSEALVDALWKPVQTCWSSEPEERLTAFVVLQALQALPRDETLEKPQGPQEPHEILEDPLDDTWDCVPDAGELEYENSNLSGSTRTYGPIGRLKLPFPHHHHSSKPRDPKNGRRARAEKRVRHLLHLSKPGLTTAVGGEKRKQETEIVDQREEKVQISDGRVSYLTSKPIPDGKRLKKVVITVVAKDQGWSSYQNDHGTYRNSWTWFELSVGPPSDSKGPLEKWRGEVVRNLHAHGDFKEHTVEISAKELYDKAESGDVLTVWAHAQFSGWRNTVKKVTIRTVVE